MSDKSYVSVGLCFFCGEDKEVILDRRLRDSLPRSGVYNTNPCDKCAEYMKQGVILISVKDGSNQENPYRTGGFAVVKEEAIKHIFQPKEVVDKVLELRMAFIEDTVWAEIGLEPVGGGGAKA